MSRRNIALAAVLFAALLLAVFVACGRTGGKGPEAPSQLPELGAVEPAALGVLSFDDDPSFEVLLSEPRDPAADAYERPPQPPARPLSRDDADAILARLPALATEATDEQDWAIREGSQPPPRTGETIEAHFPPDDELAPPDATAVAPGEAPEVLRVSPEGEVPLAPQVSVTFSHPMVDVTSHRAAVEGDVPLRIDPETAGDARWVGARTLLFEPSGERMPMATRYRVDVPAGATSATGAALEEGRQFTFETPPVEVVSRFPDGTVADDRELDQVVFLELNQRIDKGALEDFILFEAEGEALPFAWLDRDELESELEAGDRPRRRLRDDEASLRDRWVAFRATRPLPRDTRIAFGLRAGAPSAEGPLTPDASQRFSFRTYGPLRVDAAHCGRFRSTCTPGAPIRVEFSNRLDTDAFDPSMVSVEPGIEGLEVTASGSQIRIAGHKRGRQTYRIAISSELRDRHGQALRGDRETEVPVGPADPWIATSASPLVVADPASEPEVSFRSVNHATVHLEIRRVEPADWGAYIEMRRRLNRSERGQRSQLVDLEAPGERIVKTSVDIDGEPDVPTDTRIGLGEHLGADGLGNLIVVVETRPGRFFSRGQRPRRLATWVQSTSLSVDGFSDGQELIGWATSLDRGEPLSGVRLSISGAQGASITDDGGVARLSLPRSTDADEATYLKATRGDDVAFLPSSERGWRSRGVLTRRGRSDELRWYVKDDRAIYRPGETVSVKGWLRRIENRPRGDVRLDARIENIRYEIKDARGNEIASGRTQTSELGGFDLDFELPDTPNLGGATLSLTASGASGVSSRTHRHRFSIEEFRRPEFEVEARLDDEGPFFAGDRATATAEASYYAGGALAGAETRWEVEARPGSFSPPGLGDYSFGVWTPWWRSRSAASAITTESWEATTDAAGRHRLAMDLGAIEPPRPMSVEATATVTDVNRQAWSSTATYLVHPGEHYVGLRSERYFVERGEPLEVEAIVADLDGELVAGRPVVVTAARVSWIHRGGELIENLGDVQECSIESSEEPASCEFDTAAGGRYAITAVTLDDEGRSNATRMSRWVSGAARPMAREVEQEDIELIPDRDEYEPGDVAEILVSAPFSPAEALLSLRRNGVVRTQRFSLDGPTETLEIPIDSEHLPNVHVRVDAVGEALRLDGEGEPQQGLPRRPAYARGSLDLAVSTEERRLEVEIEPRADKVAPGDSTSARVRVRDHAGAPVEGAEVAVIVVDEAILALTGYTLTDPIEHFYRKRPSGVRDLYLRSHVALADPADLAPSEPPAAPRERAEQRAAAPAPGAGAVAERADAADDVGGDAGSPIAVRRDLDPLAAFFPAAVSDERGEVTLAIDMPDNLTRYRVMAIAAHGEGRFGKDEAAITARLPLMVRPSLPRFLNFGDEAELPVVVQNQTDEPMRVRVAARAANLDLEGVAGVEIEVPAADRAEVRFPASVKRAGTARVQVGAAAGAWADAAEVELPVWTPATTEAFATYGEIDEGAIVQPVRAPPDALPEFGSLDISTSSTALQALTDAFLDLYHRDFEQTERVASRMIAVAALGDILEAFDAEDMPSSGEIAEAMERDIEELAARQGPSGGFGLWYRGGESLPFISLHAAHALARAADKGYDVPQAVSRRLSSYLENIRRHIPAFYSERTRRVIIAYAHYVRAVLGEPDPEGARAALSDAGAIEDLPLVALGWLYRAMAGDADSAEARARIARHLGNRVTETAATAHFADRRSMDEGHLILHSSRRADAVILEAMIEDRPDSDLIPKLARGLLAHRVRGKWGNSQENSFVLVSLDRYFRAFESQTPDFVARAWLGDDYAGSHAFRGRQTDRHRIRIPMQHLADTAADSTPVVLQKRGAGRLYYRIGMSYAPRDLELEAADHGFSVERRYRGVDDPDDVRRGDDGTWTIRAGARVEVEVEMVAPTRRYHVALVDPLPAGLEPQNPGLAVTGDVPDGGDDDSGGWWWFARPWYQHQNMRDERVEAFSTLVWGGVHRYTYVARATTPGRFVAPPAKAEEMYHPETFGRSATARVEVVE